MDELSDSYWGLCPGCGQGADRWFNVGRAHWLTCEGCRTKWCVGENLIGSWKYESDGDWIANEMRLAEYEEVEPVVRWSDDH